MSLHHGEGRGLTALQVRLVAMAAVVSRATIAMIVVAVDGWASHLIADKENQRFKQIGKPSLGGRPR